MTALLWYNTVTLSGVGSSTYGRLNKGNYFYYTNQGVVIRLQNTVSDNSTIIIGFAMKSVNAGNFSYQSTTPFVEILDDDGNRHIGFFGADGTRNIEVRDNGGSILATGTYIIPYDSWIYAEFKVTIHDSAGVVQTRFNEVLDIDISSQDTCNGSNAYCGDIEIRPIKNYGSYHLDDLYICNGQGSKNNDFLGDIRVDALRPDGAGTHTDFTPSTGSNYENVDEDYPDDDSTYNDGSNVSDQDSYSLDDLPTPPSGSTIHGVKDQITVRKTDAGTRTAKILTVQNSSDYLGDEITLSDSFTTHARVMEDNPDDSAAWADADVNGGEVGVEIIT
jgi:hypothetical protein